MHNRIYLIRELSKIMPNGKLLENLGFFNTLSSCSKLNIDLGTSIEAFFWFFKRTYPQFSCTSLHVRHTFTEASLPTIEAESFMDVPFKQRMTLALKFFFFFNSRRIFGIVCMKWKTFLKNNFNIIYLHPTVLTLQHKILNKIILLNHPNIHQTIINTPNLNRELRQMCKM